MKLKFRPVELAELNCIQNINPEQSKRGKLVYEAGGEAILEEIVGKKLLTVRFALTLKGKDSDSEDDAFVVKCIYKQKLEMSDDEGYEPAELKIKLTQIAASLNTLAHEKCTEMANAMRFPVKLSLGGVLPDSLHIADDLELEKIKKKPQRKSARANNKA